MVQKTPCCYGTLVPKWKEGTEADYRKRGNQKMGKAKKTNGAIPIGKAQKPQEFFRRNSLDALAEDFCIKAEKLAYKVEHKQISAADSNAAKGHYSNMLRMIDLQIKARKANLVSSKSKLLGA